jgi:hypothetical protein
MKISISQICQYSYKIDDIISLYEHEYLLMTNINGLIETI